MVCKTVVLSGRFSCRPSDYRYEGSENSDQTAEKWGSTGDFAEGTRVKEGEAKAAKAGVALFALKGEAPIVPICISSKYKFRSIVHIRYGEPIYLDEYKGQKVTTEMMEEITEKVMEKVREMRVEV